MTRRFWRVFLISFFTLVFLTAAVIWRGSWERAHPEITHTTLSCQNLPKSFDKLKILHLSDLHGAFLTDDAFWAPILAEKPDMIALTGDMLSREHSPEDLENFGRLVAKFSAVCPVYYVGGNHEAQAELLWENVALQVESNGGTVLSDETCTFSRGTERITLVGLRDPARRPVDIYQNETQRQFTELALNSLDLQSGEFHLLLAHRPEDVDLYAEAGIDVALCGHTHGGQVRLPVIGAVFAPGQGLFPAYSAGLYQVQDTQLYVSRGLGGSLRILCQPEVAFLTLASA